MIYFKLPPFSLSEMREVFTFYLNSLQVPFMERFIELIKET